jgi:hypothetical protein
MLQAPAKKACKQIKKKKRTAWENKKQTSPALTYPGVPEEHTSSPRTNRKKKEKETLHSNRNVTKARRNTSIETTVPHPPSQSTSPSYM